jgi:hypothetical protein
MEVNRTYLLIVQNSYTGNEFEETIINVLEKPYAINLPLKSKDFGANVRANINARVKILYRIRHENLPPVKRGRKRIYATKAEVARAYRERHHINKKSTLPIAKVC